VPLRHVKAKKTASRFHESLEAMRYLLHVQTIHHFLLRHGRLDDSAYGDFPVSKVSQDRGLSDRGSDRRKTPDRAVGQIAENDVVDIGVPVRQQRYFDLRVEVGLIEPDLSRISVSCQVQPDIVVNDDHVIFISVVNDPLGRLTGESAQVGCGP
jgi:hypothetical protein